MSLFGTLRKKGKKLCSTTVSLSENLLDPSISKSKSLSSSTPNLLKLNPPEVPKDEDKYDYEQNPRRPKYKLFDETPSSSLLSVPSSGGNTNNSLIQEIPNPNAHYTKNERNIPKRKSSMRHLASIVSSATGLTKSKSALLKKKQLFSSETQLRPNLQESDVTEFSISLPSTEESTPDFHRHRSTPSSKVIMKGSRSEPHIQASLEDNNTEPGVISSSSSLCSSNCPSYLNLRVNSNQSQSGTSTEIINPKSETPSAGEESYYSTVHSLSHQTKEEIARTKLMLQGAKKFNMEPKRGIDFLVLNGIIQRTPESVAQYLKDGEGLSKTGIGNYLGEHHAFNLDVLNEFVKLHDFTNVLLVQALRQFLWSFRLPGEAQKIDRMMECFAKRYTELNPTLFTNSDTCYLLSFAIIMLNTSLHNPSVKNKPTLEQFIQMNRDIDAGQPLAGEFITSLYNSILTEPFQIPPEDGNDLMITFFNPEIEGWLWKQCGERYKTWKRRWFILSNNCLYYFLFTTDKDPRGIVPLENTKAKKLITPNEASNKRFCFTLYKDSLDPKVPEFIKSCKSCDGKLTAGKHVKYQLATTSASERDRWIAAVNQNSSNHDFYTLLEQKKKKMEALTKESQNNSSIYYGSLSRKTKTKPRSPIVYTVRKSQISLPLNESQQGSPVSLRQPQIQHSVSTSQLSPSRKLLKDRHANFYTSASSASINLEFSVVNSSTDDNEQYSSADECDQSTNADDEDITTSTPESPETGRRRSFEANAKGYKKKDGKNSPRFLRTPKRKASLPSYCKLLNKIDYLTEPGIRISVEDTDEPSSQEMEVKGNTMSQSSEEIEYVDTSTTNQEISPLVENIEIIGTTSEDEDMKAFQTSEQNNSIEIPVIQIGESNEEKPKQAQVDNSFTLDELQASNTEISESQTVPNVTFTTTENSSQPVQFRRINSKRKKFTVPSKRRSIVIKTHYKHKKKPGSKAEHLDEGIGHEDSDAYEDFEIDEIETNELSDLTSIINDCTTYLENSSLNVTSNDVKIFNMTNDDLRTETDV